MKKLRLDELAPALQRELAAIGDEESLVIEDENGHTCYSVIPYRRPTAEQKQRGWERLRELQAKAGQSMQEQGVTEDNVLQELLNDE